MSQEQFRNLTEPMYYLLLTLVKPLHGYGIMQEVEERTQGRVKIGAGTLYNLLARFEEEMLIEQVAAEERRKIYQITDKGRKILQAEYERLQLLVQDGKVTLAEGGNQHEA